MTHNEEQATAAALRTALTESLANPPTTARRVMAFVLDAAGQSDHLGLWLGGQTAPGAALFCACLGD